jgi:hypothetical protein
MSTNKPTARYIITLEPKAGIDAIKALRWVLKRLLRQHGLKCVSVYEEHEDRDR